MDKKFFRRFYKNIRHVNMWILLIISIVAGVICAISLRNNNVRALQLRDAVILADKENTDVEKPLKELREYVYGHMNTNLSSGPNAIKPPVQLKYRYERLVKAEQERVGKENKKIYTQAQKYCEEKFPVGLSGSGRIPCIKDYLTENGLKQNPIEDSLYKFDFVSPIWSPDLAGWSLIISSLFFAMFVIRFGMERWVQAELRDL